MATEITMPKLSDTMTEGKLISWKKSVGERVERGDIIAEVETDKANMELEAFTSGVLLETRVKPGEMVPVGTVIAVIGAAGEKPTGAGLAPPEAEPVEPPAPPPGWQPPAEEQPHEPLEPRDVPERVMERPEAANVPLPPSVAGEEGGAKASPLVRRIAREKGIDLSRLQGSGPEGRILQEDLEKYMQAPGAAREARGEAAVTEKAAASESLSRMRAAIARTVSQAWQTIPHFAVTVAIDMSEAEEVRRELKEAGSPVSLNDLIVKGAALALEKFPRVNSSFAGDRITVNREINIGFAVALDDGLVVPVITGCRGLSLREIAARGRELADRARSGKISEAEINGGTFTVSNLGMYGVEEFTAVIFPPQGAILSVGAVSDEAVVRGGQVVAARIMRATLSCDHRLIDGAYAAQFLAELKRILENPVTMLV